MKNLPLLILGLFLVTSVHAFETGGANDITAVSGRTSKDYLRVRQANGSFSPEFYAFGKGGNWSGQKSDASIDKMDFLDVAHVIAGPLATQNYIPSKDPRTAKLLIMVYWGTTHAPEHASESAAYGNLNSIENEIKTDQATSGQIVPPRTNVGSVDPRTSFAIESLKQQELTMLAAVADENKMRDQDDLLNIKMLGYDSWWDATRGDYSGTALEIRRKDLISEIE